MLPEFIRIAELVHSGKPINEINDQVLGKEKKATNKRQIQELKRRTESLTPKQIEVLTEGNIDEQKQISHLALCKAYGIYRDFVIEVLAEKIKVFDHSLTDLDYNSFISKKKMDHPELEALAETTQKKVKQVIYRMLQQVGIIDSVSNPAILSPSVQPKVETSIIEDNAEWFKCFFYTEEAIGNING